MMHGFGDIFENLAERRFAGSNGDPTFAELLDVKPDGSAPRWDEYCDAFAPTRSSV